jgi:hypothetical protein
MLRTKTVVRIHISVREMDEIISNSVVDALSGALPLLISLACTMQ